MDKIEIKKKLVEIIKSELEKKMDFLNKAIDEAQKESASHIGKMESRYDTFKEEAQAAVASYEKQLFNIKASLFLINEIPLEIFNKIKLGSVVETNENNYFISMGILNEVDIDGIKYKLTSLDSPIGQIFADKKASDEIEFRGKKMQINNVF